MRRARLVVLVVGMLAVFTIAVTAATAMALSRPAQETTVPNGETTTLAPTTEPTTTVAPTTTAEPTTTPTTEASTTTSSSTTTTTVAPAAGSTSKDDNSTTVKILIGIALVLAVAGITTFVVVRRNAQRDKAAWTNSAASALRDADLTRDMLAGEARPGQPEDAVRVSAVRDNVDRVAATFDGLAASAPTDAMRLNATAVATSLRGYFFALEAEQMLHNAPTSPTAEQLATADATKRARTADLDNAINSIRTYLEPKPAGQ